MNKTNRGNDHTHKLKIKPHTDRIRAILDALPCPGIAEIKFAEGDWRPTSRFYSYEADRNGRYYSVRQHDNKTYVFRLK